MSMQKWEYLRVTVIVSDATLNQYGDQGWELVSVIVLPDHPVYFFKRPKP
jgi:hypothetical protein